jgi:molecular chaperone GrpE (heat shock protein)
MIAKGGVPTEFDITESPFEVEGVTETSETNFWRRAVQGIAEVENRAFAAEASLRKINVAHDSAKRKLLLNVIEIVDNVDRVLAVSGGVTDPAVSQWLRRFERTRRTLEQLLAREQVVPIDFEQAPDGLVTTREEVERDDVPDGTILEVDYRGYLWRGEILRKASVVKARNLGK